MSTLFLTELTAPSTNVSVILPEVIIATAGVIVMLYDSFAPKQRAVTGVISIGAVVIAGMLLGNMWGGSYPATSWGGLHWLRCSFRPFGSNGKMFQSANITRCCCLRLSA